MEKIFRKISDELLELEDKPMTSQRLGFFFDRLASECSKELVSLDDYNKALIIKPNGIACPKCGEELIDLPIGVTTCITSKQRIKCISNTCDFLGYRKT